MKPIKMLETELKILLRCKSKSIQSFERGSIDIELHKKHLANLTPLISEFEKAIEKLKN